MGRSTSYCFFLEEKNNSGFGNAARAVMKSPDHRFGAAELTW